MLAVLSPAKSLNMERSVAAPRATRPALLAEAEPLVTVLRKRSPTQLAKLMGISPELARLNAERFSRWSTPFTSRNATRAILAFAGDVYRGFDVETLDQEDLAFAQKHLRILSGLYGVLRPLDLIQAYRLEMGTRLRVGNAADLYEHWGLSVTKALRRDLARHSSRLLINLASNEYFRVVSPETLDAPVVTPVFKQRRDGVEKVIALLSKRARGLMARFITEHRVDDLQTLLEFDAEGYRYRVKTSTDERPVFVRKG